MAFHVAQLIELRDRGLINPSQAQIVVGTSAGALVSGLLASGITLEHLKQALVDRTATPELQRPIDRLLALELPGFAGLRKPERSRRVAASRHARVALWGTSLFGEGAIDSLEIAAEFSGVLPTRWPEPLHICALHRNTGQPKVWHQSHEQPIDLAVAASCAVPGVFSPVTVDGEDYVDGGFWSPTNADVLAGMHLDEVVVISPMSTPPGSRPITADHALRLGLHTLVRSETRLVRSAGTKVTLIEPHRAVRQAMGVNFMDQGRVCAIFEAVESGYLASV